MHKSDQTRGASDERGFHNQEYYRPGNIIKTLNKFDIKTLCFYRSVEECAQCVNVAIATLTDAITTLTVVLHNSSDRFYDFDELNDQYFNVLIELLISRLLSSFYLFIYQVAVICREKFRFSLS